MDSDDERSSVNGAVEDEESVYLCSEILTKCQNLLDEISRLQVYISKNKRYLPIEMRRFQTNIKSDLEFVRKVGIISILKKGAAVLS